MSVLSEVPVRAKVERVLRGGIAAHEKRAVQAGDGRDHNDGPGALAAHDGRYGFRHRRRAEKIGLELTTDLVGRKVFGKSGDDKSGLLRRCLGRGCANHLSRPGRPALKRRSKSSLPGEISTGAAAFVCHRGALPLTILGQP